jgi:hypothetical protein
MPFKEGDPKPEGSGRKVGTPNKITVVLTEAIDQAFSDLGGAEYLKRIAIMDPKAFCALLGKRLPKDISVTGADSGPIQVIIVTGVPKKEEVKPNDPEGS